MIILQIELNFRYILNQQIVSVIYYYTEVSYHFNLKYHHIDDIKLCIFKTDLEDSILRKSAEDDLVNFLNIYKKRCINLKRSNNIKKLTFC